MAGTLLLGDGITLAGQGTEAAPVASQAVAPKAVAADDAGETNPRGRIVEKLVDSARSEVAQAYGMTVPELAAGIEAGKLEPLSARSARS